MALPFSKLFLHLLRPTCDIFTITVNVLSDDAVAEEYELSSFPTLVLVHDGRPVRFFSGPFTEKVMGEWIANAISGLAVDDASPTHNERTSDEL